MKTKVLFFSVCAFVSVVAQVDQLWARDENKYLYRDFTHSSFYSYLKRLRDGLELYRFYENPDECLDSFFLSIDQTMWVANNVTTQVHWEDPYLNATLTFGVNYADTVFQCFLFA